MGAKLTKTNFVSYYGPPLLVRDWGNRSSIAVTFYWISKNVHRSALIYRTFIANSEKTLIQVIGGFKKGRLRSGFMFHWGSQESAFFF